MTQDEIKDKFFEELNKHMEDNPDCQPLNVLSKWRESLSNDDRFLDMLESLILTVGVRGISNTFATAFELGYLFRLKEEEALCHSTIQ